MFLGGGGFYLTITVKDKLNSSQQSLAQSLATAVPAHYRNQPSNVPSSLSFPLHIPLLTSFLISKPLSTYHVHMGRRAHKKHNVKYCIGCKVQMNLKQILQACDVHTQL